MPQANLNQQYINLTTGPEGDALAANTYLGAAVAYALADKLPDESQVPLTEDGGAMAINRSHVEFIAELLHEVIAHLVATLIDAGSERDAVMENDQLRTAIEQELYGWCAP